MAELLLEIGLEEIPARMIADASEQLAGRVLALLHRERLMEQHARVHEDYSTPRRLAIHVENVLQAQPDREELLTGPAWSIAFREGSPTAAGHAFAKKAGVAVDALQKTTTAKGEYVSMTVHRPGQRAAELLAAGLPKEIGAISWPKNMYWRSGKPERYVRPVKWLLALLDDAILPLEFAGVHAGNLTYGHRILHGAGAVTVSRPGEYLQALEGAKVMADVAARRRRIRKALDHVTHTVTEMRWREDKPLVETVTHLTEWPSVVLGSFEHKYLGLPEEVLVTVMRDHQKYFAVEDEAGKLAPYFLAVLNTEADAAGLALIRHGNERVLRARFNDAQFFWNFDQKISLLDRVELLKAVTFQKDLGNYFDKTERTRAIALRLAELVAERGVTVDTGALSTAAGFAKTDLTSELVKEFTELQGVVGGLYARAQGLGEAVAQAIYWQYAPAAVTDPIPPTREGQLLGLAERIGTIVDLFRAGFVTSGSKDPYALRRAGNGIVKILAESRLPLVLHELVGAAATEQLLAEDADVGNFLRERVGFYLEEVLSFRFDVVGAVATHASHLGGGASRGEATIADVVARCEALSQVRDTDDFSAISAAFKRTSNILRQADEKKINWRRLTVREELLVDEAEQTLHASAKALIPKVELLRTQRNYAAALEQIATLRPHVDRFFDKVMVLVDDEAVRGNRLALLAEIVSEFSRIAAFSEIVVAGA